MNRKVLLLVIVMLAAVLLPAGWAAAEPAAPAVVSAAGDVFPIGPAEGYKNMPVADMDAAGNMVVAWNDMVQHLNADGSPKGVPIKVSDEADNFGIIDGIAVDYEGNFVVVTSVYYEVRGRCFRADGTPLGPDFALDDAGRGGESPAVEMAQDGSFVAVWSEQYYDSINGLDYQISGRRFSSDCTPIGSAFTVNNVDTGEEWTPDIAMDAAGNFIVAWTGWDNYGGGVHARLFKADGAPRGGQFRVNQRQPFDQGMPSVGMDAAGNSVIAYNTWVKHPSVGFNNDVLIRRFDATGKPLGNEFSPHNPSLDVEYLPRVAVAPSGDFAVMWTIYTYDRNRDLWLQAYRASGEAIGPMRPVAVDQWDEYLGALVTGNGEEILAVWSSQLTLEHTQIYGRLFDFDEPAVAYGFWPTNDAYVMEARPNNTFGSQKVLQVKDAVKDANTYIKFNVNSLSGTAQSATLRLWVNDPGPDGGAVYATSPFYEGTTTLWLETGLTWNNAPAIGGEPLDVVGPAVKGYWVELDVTAAVVAAQNDNGRVSLAITNDARNLVKYASDESAKRPELIVYTD